MNTDDSNYSKDCWEPALVFLNMNCQSHGVSLTSPFCPTKYGVKEHASPCKQNHLLGLSFTGLPVSLLSHPKLSIAKQP